MTTTARRTAALVTALALAAGAAPLALAGPAQADTERSGAISGGGRYDLSVDGDDGRFDVSVDLDDVAPGSRWRIVVRQDGQRFVRTVLTADNEGDLGLERVRPNTAGADRFALRATSLADGTVVRASITR